MLGYLCLFVKCLLDVALLKNSAVRRENMLTAMEYGSVGRTILEVACFFEQTELLKWLISACGQRPSLLQLGHAGLVEVSYLCVQVIFKCFSN